MHGKSILVFLVVTSCVIMVWNYTAGVTFEGEIHELLDEAVPAGSPEAAVGDWIVSCVKLALLACIASSAVYAIVANLYEEPHTYYY